MANLKSLEKLTLSGPSEIGLRLDFIHQLLCLRELQLIELQIRNTSLESLEGVTRLKALSVICPCDIIGTITTDRVVRVLRPLVKLQHFEIDIGDEHIDRFTDAADIIQVLSKLSSLRTLRMQGVSIDNASLRILCATCPGIKSLHINCDRITDPRFYYMTAFLPVCR